MTEQATYIAIDPTRSAEPAIMLLGEDYSGTRIHDGWSVYDRFTQATHQQCLAHLMRRWHELLKTAVPERCGSGAPRGTYSGLRRRPATASGRAN